MTSRTKRKLNRCLLLIPLLLALAALIYIETYYRADETALAALKTDAIVTVSQTDYGWFFDGPSDDKALIFYPGAKVEEAAYAPLMRALAESGVDACLVKMPGRLAFFGTKKAAAVMEQHDCGHWYIGGHSLGGVAASAFAADNAELLDGVILLASYPTEALDDSLTVVTIYGSNDEVLNLKAYRENLKNVPADASEYVIEGGNHAQFGSYGFQKGDGTAAISAEEQVRETVQAILDNI